MVRFALELPAVAELRFTPELERRGARLGGRRVLPRAGRDRGGGEREMWSRLVDAREKPAGEQVVRLPGQPGDIVRIGLAVGEAGRAPLRLGPLRRAARARLRRQRIRSSRRRSPPPRTRGPTACARASPAANVLLIILDAGRAQQFGAYGYSRATTPRDRPHRRGGGRLRARLHAGRRTRSARCRRCGPRSTPTATTARSRSTRSCRRTG